MSRFFNKRQVNLDDHDAEYGLLSKEDNTRKTSKVSIEIGTWSAITLMVLLVLSITSSCASFFGVTPLYLIRSRGQHSLHVASGQRNSVCEVTTVRQEWRTLSDDQKQNYIEAVQCLATKPSILHSEGSLYDDFPWVHKDRAAKTHVSAAFLPWHRNYIHAYEKALREECGLKIGLPYWDWSLDWESPSTAPVWDEHLGLGGDGDINGLETVGGGRCVTKGPFAELKVRYFDGEYQPHCLSRGFPSESELRELGHLVKPSAIEHMMKEPVYSRFEEDLEKRAHHFLSHSVRGDLSRFTGPNDPVFFLHHANIDRLWWRWQQASPSERLYAYDGRADNVTENAASLSNIMDMAGLMANGPVSRTMEIERFCYSY